MYDAPADHLSINDHVTSKKLESSSDPVHVETASDISSEIEAKIPRVAQNSSSEVFESSFDTLSCAHSGGDQTPILASFNQSDTDISMPIAPTTTDPVTYCDEPPPLLDDLDAELEAERNGQF